MKRPVSYAETSIITQKQAFFTHFAWKRPQICTFWHEKAGILCRNINNYAKTSFFHTFCMEKAANMYFLTWKGQCFMQKHQSLRKNKLFSHILHGKCRKYVLSDMKRPVFYVETSIITQKQTLFTHLTWKRPQICTFWHEKAGILCRNINNYAKTSFFHTFCMEKAANMYFLTWKGRYLMQKHQ